MMNILHCKDRDKKIFHHLLHIMWVQVSKTRIKKNICTSMAHFKVKKKVDYLGKLGIANMKFKSSYEIKLKI